MESTDRTYIVPNYDPIDGNNGDLIVQRDLALSQRTDVIYCFGT